MSLERYFLDTDDIMKFLKKYRSITFLIFIIISVIFIYNKFQGILLVFLIPNVYMSLFLNKSYGFKSSVTILFLILFLFFYTFVKVGVSSSEILLFKYLSLLIFLVICSFLFVYIFKFLNEPKISKTKILNKKILMNKLYFLLFYLFSGLLVIFTPHKTINFISPLGVPEGIVLFYPFFVINALYIIYFLSISKFTATNRFFKYSCFLVIFILYVLITSNLKDFLSIYHPLFFFPLVLSYLVTLTSGKYLARKIIQFFIVITIISMLVRFIELYKILY